MMTPTKSRRGRRPKHPYSPKTLPDTAWREFKTLATSRLDWRAHDFQSHFAKLGYPLGIEAIRKTVTQLRRAAGLVGPGKGRPSLVEPALTKSAGLPIKISITCHGDAAAARALAALAGAFGDDGGLG